MYFEVSEPYTCTKIDERALQAWKQDGVLRIADLIPPEWFEYLSKRLIEVLGSSPENPEVWSNLQSSPLKQLGRDKRCVALEVEAVKEAVDQVIGEGWEYPQTGGGWFANEPRHVERQNLPDVELVPRGIWHWDGRPDLHAVKGIWLFTPVTEMLPHSGGTWLVAGSGQKVIDFYSALSPEKKGQPTKTVKKWFAEAHEWFKVISIPVND